MAFRFEFMTLTSEKSTQILSNKLLQIHLAFMQLISRKLMTKVCHCATIKVGKLFQFQTLKLFSLVLLLCLHPWLLISNCQFSSLACLLYNLFVSGDMKLWLSKKCNFCTPKILCSYPAIFSFSCLFTKWYFTHHFWIPLSCLMNYLASTTLNRRDSS